MTKGAYGHSICCHCISCPGRAVFWVLKFVHLLQWLLLKDFFPTPSVMNSPAGPRRIRTSALDFFNDDQRSAPLDGEIPELLGREDPALQAGLKELEEKYGKIIQETSETGQFRGYSLIKNQYPNIPLNLFHDISLKYPDSITPSVYRCFHQFAAFDCPLRLLFSLCSTFAFFRSSKIQWMTFRHLPFQTQNFLNWGPVINHGWTIRPSPVELDDFSIFPMKASIRRGFSSEPRLISGGYIFYHTLYGKVVI